MRTITAIAALAGTLMIPVVGFFNIPAAQADSLSAKEYSFVTEYGQSVICPAIAKYHSINGVVGVVKGVMDQGFSAAEAVEITNKYLNMAKAAQEALQGPKITTVEQCLEEDPDDEVIKVKMRPITPEEEAADTAWWDEWYADA